MTLTVLLAACGAEESSPLDEARENDDPAQEQRAEDEQALEQLATDLWAARRESQNTGSTAREPFADILSPGLIEEELARLARYEDLELTRKGGPEITAIEASPSGDEAEVTMCLNEDEWPAFEADRPVDFDKRGAVPHGFAAQKDAERWVVAEILPREELEAMGTSC